MKKENLLLGIIGLLAGLILGYIGTNQLNQSSAPAKGGKPAELQTSNPAGNPGNSSAGGAQGEVIEAIELARKEPGNYAAQMKAGALFSEIKRFEQAIEFYERAVKANPREPEGVIRLGDTYFDLGRYDEAQRTYQSALQLQPQNATVRMDLGLTYYLRQPRDLDRAITEFREALRLDSRHEKTLVNLTKALIEKGDLTAARQTLDSLVAVNPDNPGIQSLRSQLSK